ncbi:DUF1772 domain-containing protein [Streptomyces sp. DG2A-72]|uniref:DUF1772 domain-containing protein n=1 Tax=Streptomyces sp. DG2A-72 TaxID=3051386 RepID=UPI00265C61D2|nr:DUF1772 domain-containing protein [Streptomyces sp. DG2A-72]MDO0937266.1 DUF1772 domain-containing protein [Streptomyces sp. DG2A-72]
MSILANAVVYGTDVFCAIVQRPALAHVDDAALTQSMGQVHRFGDRRMPIPGVTGLVAALVVAAAAGFDGSATVSVSAGIAVAALVIWLVVYGTVSAPVNKRLTAAALDGRTAPDARSLQGTWDGVINARVLLQTVALGALCIALAAS